MKLIPVLFETDKRFNKGDVVTSIRYGDKLLQFGNYENSYDNEVVKTYDLILVDITSDILEDDYYLGGINSPHMYIASKNLIRDNDTKYYHDKRIRYISKVISSTNKLHELPQLSNESKLSLINYYNEHKCMPESVSVIIHNECDNCYCACYPKDCDYFKLQGKVTITIAKRTVLEGLEEYFKTHTREQVLKDWIKFHPYDIKFVNKK